MKKTPLFPSGLNKNESMNPWNNNKWAKDNKTTSKKRKKFPNRNLPSWAAINNWIRDKSLILIITPTICYTDSTYSGPLCQLISFIKPRLSSNFLDTCPWPNILTKYTLCKEVATTPRIITSTSINGQNFTKPSSMMILKMPNNNKMPTKNLSFSISRPLPVTTSTE